MPRFSGSPGDYQCRDVNLFVSLKRFPSLPLQNAGSGNALPQSAPDLADISPEFLSASHGWVKRHLGSQRQWRLKTQAVRDSSCRKPWQWQCVRPKLHDG